VRAGSLLRHGRYYAYEGAGEPAMPKGSRQLVHPVRLWQRERIGRVPLTEAHGVSSLQLTGGVPRTATFHGRTAMTPFMSQGTNRPRL